MPFGKLQTFQGVRKEQQKLELELRVRNGPEDCELSQNLVRRMIADLMKELEACAYAYFTANWYCVENLVSVNAQAAQRLGLTDGKVHIPISPAAQKNERPAVTRDGAQQSGGNESGEEAAAEGSRAEWRARARANWQRAFGAISKKVTMDMLGVTRSSKTLKEVFGSMARPGSVWTDVVQYKRQGILDSSIIKDEQPDTKRQPVLLLLGGGMAAGKSTVREIIGQSDFWSKVAPDAVVVEADAIKEWDHLFRHLAGPNTNYRHDKAARKFAHEYSTRAAEAILVAAINEQKDVIFDGTMTWGPFVEQTIAMARDHNRAYVCGPGYVAAEAGRAAVERYYDAIPADEQRAFRKKHPNRMPYRIEMIGVTCDPGLAVCRGIWRWLSIGRGVPISAQLRSHRLFAENFEGYTQLVDSATLYFTGAALTTFNKGHIDTSPQVIAHCSSATRGELLVNNCAFNIFKGLSKLNELAESREKLFSAPIADAGALLAKRPGRIDVNGGDNQGSGSPKHKARKYVPYSDPSRMQGLRAVFAKINLERVAPAVSSHPISDVEGSDKTSDAPSPDAEDSLPIASMSAIHV